MEPDVIAMLQLKSSVGSSRFVGGRWIPLTDDSLFIQMSLTFPWPNRMRIDETSGIVRLQRGDDSIVEASPTSGLPLWLPTVQHLVLTADEGVVIVYTYFFPKG